MTCGAEILNLGGSVIQHLIQNILECPTFHNLAHNFSWAGSSSLPAARTSCIYLFPSCPTLYQDGPRDTLTCFYPAEVQPHFPLFPPASLMFCLYYGKQLYVCIHTYSAILTPFLWFSPSSIFKSHLCFCIGMSTNLKHAFWWKLPLILIPDSPSLRNSCNLLFPTSLVMVAM